MHIANPIRYFQVEYYRATANLWSASPASPLTARPKEQKVFTFTLRRKLLYGTAICFTTLAVLCLYLALMVGAGFGGPTP